VLLLLTDADTVSYTPEMLKKWLIENGKSQTWLAAEFGIRQSAVAKWIRFRVPAERVLKVSELTGIPPEDLRPDVFRSPCL